MTFTEEQVEWIVAEVLRRLGVVASGSNRSPADRAELRIHERVVTLRTIEKRLTGVTRVVVAQKAIVTPSVKDELKTRKVTLVYQCESPK